MIRVTVDDREVKRLLQQLPKSARRAAEQALDQTVREIYLAIGEEVGKVFDNPAPYTKSSLKYTKTKNHNMQSSVWFRDPERMSKHYLVPEVEGVEREYKGFERALGRKKFIPSETLKSSPSGNIKLDRYGNVSAGLIRQILGVLGRAETSGYQANLTTKSGRRNKKDRDYVYLPRGSRRGALPPGIYQRVVRGTELTAKQRRSNKAFGTYEQGKRQVGVLQGKGRFRIEQNVVRARGLRPVLIVGKQRAKYKPLLKFYHIAAQVYTDRFRILFFARFNSLANKQR